MLGVWDGNRIKLDCDDHCTPINVINSLSNKKKPDQTKTKFSFFFLGLHSQHMEVPRLGVLSKL